MAILLSILGVAILVFIVWTSSSFNKTFTIKKGNHYSSFIMRFYTFFKPKALIFEVTFDKSWIYDFHDYNQGDINKVVGVGYFPGIHKNSIRFGARYNPKSGRVDIIPYAYVNGVRTIPTASDGSKLVLASCLFNQTYTFILGVSDLNYTLRVDKDGISQGQVSIIRKGHNKKIGCLLRPYFGGDYTAPQNVITKISKS